MRTNLSAPKKFLVMKLAGLWVVLYKSWGGRSWELVLVTKMRICLLPHVVELMTIKGELFVYDAKHRLVAFKSGSVDSRRSIILVGGLTDGLCSLPYVDELNSSCQKNGYTLIQLIMRSSYSGFGVGSLANDAEDLQSLIAKLIEQGISSIHLVGHSTGCQDIIWLLRTFDSPVIKTITLQGPVSDADYISSHHKHLVDCFHDLNCKTEDEILPFTLFGAPVSSYRFKSLAIHGYDDDMFSYKSPLKEKILPANKPALVVMSGRDQFVPENTSKHALLDEFNCENKLMLEFADHFISDEQSQHKFTNYLFKFIGNYESAN
jgi:pimeloyl-ACP methyl ester carboxylesterase